MNRTMKQFIETMKQEAVWDKGSEVVALGIMLIGGIIMGYYMGWGNWMWVTVPTFRVAFRFFLFH